MATVSVSSLHETFQSPLSAYWGGTYGGADAVGGYGQVPCAHSGGTPTPAALLSTQPTPGDTWSFSGATLHAQVAAVPDGAGATTALCRMAVLSATAGTYLSVAYNAVTGQLEFGNYSGGTDTGLVTITYSPTAHIWWRIRHATGKVYYETSADASTWILRRTVTGAPSWINTNAVSVELYASRDGGTNDVALFDDVNAVSDTASPALINAGSTIPPVTIITTSGDAYAYPDTVESSTSIPTPMVRAGTGPTPDPILGTATVYTPTLVTTTPITDAAPVAVMQWGGAATVTALPTARMPLVSGSAIPRDLAGSATPRRLTGSAVVT